MTQYIIKIIYIYIYDCPYPRKHELSFYKSRPCISISFQRIVASHGTKFSTILHSKRNKFSKFTDFFGWIIERIDRNINSNILLRSRHDMTKQILASRINNCLQTLLSGRGLSIVDHSDHYLRITMPIDTYLRFIQIRPSTTM